MDAARRRALLQLTEIGRSALTAADFSTDESRPAPLGRGETVPPSHALNGAAPQGIRGLVTINDGSGARRMTMPDLPAQGERG
jgi:hypothetical protein